ncbi:MAG TPA: hypothetical protein VJT50_14265, partial [Pyrinomonadaceae bacterium]|nr:hypothetical protein [Pyrinomonadaceae bacterium]
SILIRVTRKPSNDRVDAAARIQIDNRQLEIGNDFSLPPLASNDLLGGASVEHILSNTLVSSFNTVPLGA